MADLPQQLRIFCQNSIFNQNYTLLPNKKCCVSEMIYNIEFRRLEITKACILPSCGSQIKTSYQIISQKLIEI